MDDDDIPNFSFNIDFQDLFNSVANGKTTVAAGNDENIAFKLDAQQQQNAATRLPLKTSPT